MSGRWPANVILAPGAAEILDEQSGVLKSGGGKRNSAKSAGILGAYAGDEPDREFEANEGGASRFFLNAGYEQWELEWIYSSGLKPCGTEETP